MANILKVKIYVKENKNGLVVFYEDGKRKVAFNDEDIKNLINESVIQLGGSEDMSLIEKIKFLNKEGIITKSSKDIIKHITLVYEKNEDGIETKKVIVERLSGLKEEKESLNEVTDELKETYDISSVEALEEMNILERKKNNAKKHAIKNFICNKKKLISVIVAGAVLVTGGYHLIKNKKDDNKQPNNDYNDSENVDYTDNTNQYENENEMTFDPTISLPTPEPTVVPTQEPTVVPTPEPTAVPTIEPTAEPIQFTFEPDCVVEYMNQDGYMISREEYGKDNLDNIYYMGNAEEYCGMDTLGNYLANPEENPKPEIINIINYNNIVSDQDEMEYIKYFASLRNEIATNAMTLGGENREALEYNIVSANSEIVRLIRDNGTIFQSSKTFDTLSEEARNAVLQISQQIYRPFGSINMVVSYNNGQEQLTPDDVATIIVDAYGYSK